MKNINLLVHAFQCAQSLCVNKFILPLGTAKIVIFASTIDHFAFIFKHFQKLLTNVAYSRLVSLGTDERMYALKTLFSVCRIKACHTSVIILDDLDFLICGQKCLKNFDKLATTIQKSYVYISL